MSGQRVLGLDVVRGFALLGIGFGNLTWFTGYAVLSADARTAMATASYDAAVTWAIHFLVDGKFYGIFSLLFGAGFAIGIERSRQRGANASTRAFRRLAILFVFGMAHATLLWFGDIVSLYAVVGLALLVFVRASVGSLLVWAMVSFAIPVVVAACLLWFEIPKPGYGPGDLIPAFGGAGYAGVMHANWEFLEGRWILALFESRAFKLLGLFLLGVCATKTGLSLEPQRHGLLLRRLCRWGFAVGLPFNIALVFLKAAADGPWLGFIRESVDAIAVPSLAVGYSAGLLLLLESKAWRGRLAWLALPGRMTLTHYIGQTLIAVGIFYGYGLGLWGKLGALWIVPLVVAIFLAQAAFSAVWLRRFAHGPLEWLWRVSARG